MTAEERKAIAMRVKWWPPTCHAYPKCCAYHEGFDDALALLQHTAAPHLWSIEPPRQR